MDNERSVRASKIAKLLEEHYPNDTRTALNYNTPFELLIATILAAQCTDEKVNQITPVLFSRFKDACALAQANQEEVERIIKPTGFFRNKARAIILCSKEICERFHGEVPSKMEDLVTLPGVGRKTANVIRTNCFGLPGIVVDTHVLRLSQRLDLSSKTVADDVEQDLMALLPEKDWSSFSHRLQWHGRRVCNAKKPLCNSCFLLSLCPFGQKS